MTAVKGGEMSSPVATQLVLYANDAVEVSYADGSFLQVAPCGTTFVYHKGRQSHQHPLQGEKRIQQRTQFVTSEFRIQVQEAIDFRNRFSQHPYLCRDILDQHDIIKLHGDVTEIAWPSDASNADLLLLPGGHIKLVSADENAAITLAPHQQYFTVEYLAKVSQKITCNTFPYKPLSGGKYVAENKESKSVSSSSGVIQTREKQKSKDTIPITYDGDTATEQPGKWEYIWVVKHYSVQECPPSWQHPLQVLIDFVSPLDNSIASLEQSVAELHRQQSNKHDSLPEKDISATQSSTPSQDKAGQEADVNERGDSSHHTQLHDSSCLRKLLRRDFSSCIFSKVPHTLPLNCTLQHLHKWQTHMLVDEDKNEAPYIHGKIKVICSSGVIYRLLWSNPRSVEIYPGGGSLIKSSGMAGHYFTHYICAGGQVEERMYSVKSPPPYTPGLLYSSAKLITRASRYLSQVCEESLQLLEQDDVSCWMMRETERPKLDSLPTVMLEECTVTGLGRFTAFSNGHLRVVFSDRTCLDMCCDAKSDSVLHQQHRLSPSRVLDLPPGMVRLLLPSGHYQLVSISNPNEYHRYVSAAQQWAAWVNCPPSERYHFYKDTIHDPDKHKDIETELKKIQCFNYLVDNDLIPRFATTQVSDEAIKDQEFIHRPLYPDSKRESSTSTNHNGSFESGDAGLDFAAVQAALQRTAAAVKDLDSFISNKSKQSS